MMLNKAELSRYLFVFLRHGESIGNAEARFQGQADFPLTETGLAQARALAHRWQAEGESFDLIFSSPLTRARQTAEILAEAISTPLELDPIWMERDNGEMSGLTREEAREKFPQPDFLNPYDSFAKNGEGDWALFLRAGHALHDLLQRPPGRYLVVSHGGLLNKVMLAILGITPQANNQGPSFFFENTAFARLEYLPQRHRWRFMKLNDREHWKIPDAE